VGDRVSDGLLDVWPPLTPLAYFRRTVTGLPFPLETPGCRLHVRPIHALYAGLTALGLQPGDQVLVPAHHDAAQVEVLMRAGLACVFYGSTPDLEPDEEELTDRLGPRSRALYLSHLLGFPRDTARWRRWCDERGLVLIEDATQAWLATSHGEPVGTHADLSIHGLDAMLPLPNLTAALVRSGSLQSPGSRRRERGLGLDRVVMRHRAWVAGKSGVVQGLIDWSSARDPDEPGRSGLVDGDMTLGDVALDDPTLRPGPVGAFLLARLTGGDPARARRENYRLLQEQLADLVPSPFDQLPEGAAPLVFPIDVPDKHLAARRLADRQVRWTNVWSSPHPSVPPSQAAIADRGRAGTVGLPVHQRLNTIDLDRIAEAVRPSARREERFYIDQVDDLDALRDEWTPLAVQTSNIFATWEWHRTWWDHFGNGNRLAITTLRDLRGTLRGVVPLYLWKQRPVRIARFLGNTAGDQLGPICAAGDEAAVGRTIRDLVRGGQAWDMVLGEQLPGGCAWGKRLSGRVVSREGSPVVRFAGTWEETTGRWSRRLRKELRRDERRLRDDHDLQITTLAADGDLETELDTFFTLHRARWPDRTRFEQRESFHRDFARQAFDKGWLRLRIATADGKPAAARLGFRYRDIESGYQSGWDADYSRYSLGILLAADTIRVAHEDGMKEFRFLRGGEDYKYRFANADPGLETVILSRGATAGLATAGVAFKGTAVPRYVRQLMDPND
jgi:CelD/BcsL family acetyltransferase involved in cellulose biosynthesis